MPLPEPLDMSLTVTLPWPAKTLWPNRRDKWGKIEHAQYARGVAYAYAMNELDGHGLEISGALEAVYHFNPPDRRRRDLDNMLAACKSYQDGVCLALEVDDQVIVKVTAIKGDVVDDGCVTMTLKRLEVME